MVVDIFFFLTQMLKNARVLSRLVEQSLDGRSESVRVYRPGAHVALFDLREVRSYLILTR